MVAPPSSFHDFILFSKVFAGFHPESCLNESDLIGHRCNLISNGFPLTGAYSCLIWVCFRFIRTRGRLIAPKRNPI